MKYHMSNQEENFDLPPARMTMVSNVSTESLLTLPDGAEVFLIDIAPMGVAIRAQNVCISEGLREEIRRTTADCDGDHSEHSFALGVILLPESFAPSEVPDNLITKGH